MASIEESIEVNVPIRVAYNQWTQFEEFPRFMEGVKEVRQLDDKHLHWKAEIAGKTKEWDAEITEQRPDERIAWTSRSGPWNAGVVTFHRLDDQRTKVMLQVDYDPDGVVENLGDALGVAVVLAGDGRDQDLIRRQPRWQCAAEMLEQDPQKALEAAEQGAVEHGEPVEFEEMEAIDLVVVGTVAATRAGGRTGKGGGFADLELGIFREVGTVTPATPVVTTVHSSQVVADDEIPMLAHDSPLDWVVTERDAIETRTRYTRPTGVAWEVVQPDQYEGIPFLKALRERLEQAG